MFNTIYKQLCDNTSIMTLGIDTVSGLNELEDKRRQAALRVEAGLVTMAEATSYIRGLI